MEERARRMERLFRETLDLADRLHADPQNSDAVYEDLRTHLAGWNRTIENVSWLAHFDRNEAPNPRARDWVSTRQIEACLNAKRALLHRKGIFTDTHRLEELNLAGNPDLTRIIWENLLDNAIRYNERGGFISIAVEEVERHAIITIMDGGRGIAEEHLPHIFERYARFGDDANVGLGLGLAVVKEGILSMKGNIACVSHPGKGTMMHIRMPLARGR